MYENFIMRKTSKGNIAGYEWKVENPDKVVCIVHGIGEHCGRYERMASAFNERNLAVMAMDLRGHGLSMNKKGHCAPRTDVLEDITVMINYAMIKYPGKPVVLYGHSMGGNITLDYRGRGKMNSQVAGYVISAPWIRLVNGVPAPVVKAVKYMSKAAPSFIIGSAVDESKLGNPQSVGPYSKDPLVHNKISLQTAYEGFSIGEALEKGTNQDKGKAHSVPLLLMHGSDDGLCDVEGSRIVAERMKANGENMEYVEWEGLYHEIHNGGPDSNGDEVIAKAAEWICSL